MTTRIILFFALLTYSIIVSQSFMYIISLKNVQLTLNANAYTELRQLIDASMRSNFKFVIYAGLLANMLLVVFTFKNPESLIFITASIGFLALIADTLLTVKGNLPINDVINTWSADHYPANWVEFRSRWFNIYQYRQIVTIVGFTSLVFGIVFSGKSE